MTVAVRASDAQALCALGRQTEESGAMRRVVLLQVDRFPPSLGKPHHLRLARAALQTLMRADRAQLFELSKGRVAIAWREDGGRALLLAREALEHLLLDQPGDQAALLNNLLTVFDLPGQARSLIDEVADAPTFRRPSQGNASLDPSSLARLEECLAHADLAHFARCRAVVALPTETLPREKDGQARVLAWEERYFAIHDLTASLCPNRNLHGDPWLFRRLTRTLDNRLLAMLATPRGLPGNPFAINLNVTSILSPDFLRFDAALPLVMRGSVILKLRAADIMADFTDFAFARNFARMRGYRLALAGTTPDFLRFFDADAAGFEIVTIALDEELRAIPPPLRDSLPPKLRVVLTGLNRPSDVRWSIEQGFELGRGRMFNQ